MELTYPDIRTNFAIALLILFDFIWFSVSFTRIYPQLPDAKVKFAIGAWILIALSIGCGRPVSHEEALIYGATLGAIIYGVFNSTEAAIRSDWRKIQIIVSDIIWGTLLCAFVSLLCSIIQSSSNEIKLLLSCISISFYVVVIISLLYKDVVKVLHKYDSEVLCCRILI